MVWLSVSPYRCNTTSGQSGGHEGRDILREEERSDAREIIWECGVDAARHGGQ